MIPWENVHGGLTHFPIALLLFSATCDFAAVRSVDRFGGVEAAGAGLDVADGPVPLPDPDGRGVRVRGGRGVFRRGIVAERRLNGADLPRNQRRGRRGRGLSPPVNRDLCRSRHLPDAPQTWFEFASIVKNIHFQSSIEYWFVFTGLQLCTAETWSPPRHHRTLPARAGVTGPFRPVCS
jgi:hypothetical protein